MALLNVQLSPSLEDLVESYDCGEDNTTCPNETTCCTGKRACCPVENTYQCCNVEDENVSISSHSSSHDSPLPVTENKYSNVVSLSISAPWSNRGDLKATHSQPQLYNDQLPLSSGCLLSRLGRGAALLLQLHAMCPQREPRTLYGADKTCERDLL